MPEVLNEGKRVYANDLSLASACARGEESAWEEFRLQYFAFIYAFARHSMRSDTEGEDLASQIVSDLWQRKRIGMYAGMSSLRTWLGVVIAHAAINALKKSKKLISLDEKEFRKWEKQNTVLPDEDLSSRKKAIETVRQSLAEQPRQDRLLLLLYYQQGLTLREITAVFRITEASLSRRLNKIRERIRKATRRKLGPDYGSVVASFLEDPELGLDLQKILKCNYE